MMKFINLFQEKITPIFMKVGENKILLGIRNGIALTMPLTIIGSLFLIIGNLPIASWGEKLGKWGPMIGMPVNFTFGILGIVACIGISYNLAKEYEVDGINAIVLSVVAFLMAQANKDWSLNTGTLGASGLFTAIVISIVVVFIIKFFVNKNLVITMPEGVPPAIAKTFASLVPGFFIVTLVWIIRVVCNFDINAFVTTIFSPLATGLNTLPGMLLYVFLIMLLWCGGLHGSNIMGTIGDPIFLTMLAKNSEAFAKGQPIPYIFAGGFYITYLCIGGTGSTLGLVINMLFSKHKAYRSLGKLSLGPAIFCINEPVVFGFPIVMNPIMMIPYIITPLFLCVSSYFLMTFNIIAPIVIAPPWTTPPVLNAYLATGGSITSAIWTVVSLVICVLIYRPFFKICEKEELAKLENK